MEPDPEIEATGTLREYFEHVIRARGHLYEFHHLIGRADRLLGEAITLLEQAGHEGWACHLRDEVLGRDVIPGSWTYELVEAFDDTYYDAAASWERQMRMLLADGARHRREARMKERRQQATPCDEPPTARSSHEEE